MGKKLISIIVPAHNEVAGLSSFLEGQLIPVLDPETEGRIALRIGIYDTYPLSLTSQADTEITAYR